MNQTLKILIVGPSQAGKTAIANYISGKSDKVSQNYRPTSGCRILELEREVGVRSSSIELWDVSGNTSYAKCWPGITRNATGIILVFNTDQKKDADELKGWLKNFHESIQIPTAQCITFAHHPNGTLKVTEARKTPSFPSKSPSQLSQYASCFIQSVKEIDL